MLICGKFVKLCSLCLMDNLVEHEFTVNKQFSIKNLKEKSLIELRWVQTICQHQKNPPKEVQITRDMLYYIKETSQKYKEDLCQQRQEKENERKSLK